MNILLLGATGATGKYVLTRALAAGHIVTVLVRDPAKISVTDPQLRVITGDATNETDLRSAIAGNELLISTLGAMQAPIITNSTKAIISAAKGTTLKRVIMLSSFAARRNQLKASAKLITGLVMKDVIADKRSGEELLRKSSLNWTLVYATRLTNKRGSGMVYIVPESEKVGLVHSIARADVAAWIFSEAVDQSHTNANVLISNK